MCDMKLGHDLQHLVACTVTALYCFMQYIIALVVLGQDAMENKLCSSTGTFCTITTKMDHCKKLVFP